MPPHPPHAARAPKGPHPRYASGLRPILLGRAEKQRRYGWVNRRLRHQKSLLRLLQAPRSARRLSSRDWHCLERRNPRHPHRVNLTWERQGLSHQHREARPLRRLSRLNAWANLLLRCRAQTHRVGRTRSQSHCWTCSARSFPCCGLGAPPHGHMLPVRLPMSLLSRCSSSRQAPQRLCGCPWRLLEASMNQ